MKGVPPSDRESVFSQPARRNTNAAFCVFVSSNFLLCGAPLSPNPTGAVESRRVWQAPATPVNCDADSRLTVRPPFSESLRRHCDDAVRRRARVHATDAADRQPSCQDSRRVSVRAPFGDHLVTLGERSPEFAPATEARALDHLAVRAKAHNRECPGTLPRLQQCRSFHLHHGIERALRGRGIGIGDLLRQRV